MTIQKASILKTLSNILTFLLLFGCAAWSAPLQADPDMQRLWDTWSSLGGRSVSTLTAAQARSQPSLQTAVRVLRKKLGKSTAPESVASVKSIKVPGDEGDLQALLYTPKGEGPFPILVYFHGGGWVLGGLDDYDASARALANAANCMVISVAYRQAPEHPYPAAFKDAYASYSYIAKNAAEFGGDPRRVAVGGEGSGANLAATVCLQAMELRGKMPIHQLLICPITNASFETPSYRRNAKARPYSRADLQWFFQQYAGGKKVLQSPYVSILKKNAVDLPPATVIVAELDPLASEGEAYHKHLLNGAVDSQLGLYSGVGADFFGTGAVVAKAKKAVDFAGKRLRKAFTINRPYKKVQRLSPSGTQGTTEK